MEYISSKQINLSDLDIQALEKNLDKAKFIEESYEYTLVFDNISISMNTGRDGTVFHISVNQANNIWFEVFGNDVSLKDLIMKKREQFIMEKNKYNYDQLKELFQRDMNLA